jgi:hypothetical protein
MCAPWSIVSACVMTAEGELMSHDEAASASVVIVTIPAFTDAGYHHLIMVFTLVSPIDMARNASGTRHVG